MFPLFVFVFDQKLTDEYIHIRIRSQVDIPNIFVFVFVAKLNIRHTLLWRTNKMLVGGMVVLVINTTQLQVSIKTET